MQIGSNNNAYKRRYRFDSIGFGGTLGIPLQNTDFISSDEQYPSDGVILWETAPTMVGSLEITYRWRMAGFSAEMNNLHQAEIEEKSMGIIYLTREQSVQSPTGNRSLLLLSMREPLIESPGLLQWNGGIEQMTADAIDWSDM